MLAYCADKLANQLLLYTILILSQALDFIFGPNDQEEQYVPQRHRETARGKFSQAILQYLHKVLTGVERAIQSWSRPTPGHRQR